MYDGKAVRGPGNEASLCDKAVDLQNSRRARGTEHVMEDPRAKCSRRGPMSGGGGPMSRGAQCPGGPKNLALTTVVQVSDICIAHHKNTSL